MEVIRLLKRKSQDKVEFVRDLVVFMASPDVDFSNEVLFKDAVDEIYSILREEVIENGNKELASAYEKAVLLRAAVFGEEMDPKKLLKGILEELR
ncbi:hypothetical protein TK0010 [Thermococcus kodakarensis KOD1]|uniref:Uncharacterized protein n=1 Tax=Thermococcus kodakarensis (strain ATCC BAA-918 / JCM 12380 / KOD1) TaxID=69014 RepID=Q5JEC1_THEKO|nr:hypothetical protein [Thermococcus kodakarensis]WCN28135.1 hypothetical protein POG15_00055 [Thermococcus kodakarensis]WCN30432.1 hypothetical protein POG21_00055 [Thermococcus kodakarensis]BAD84199.1 hypothetical protein TK0010 [Thermococcus kodakarensis KOD1]